ncbi:Sip1-related alpha-galactosidase [Akkermansia sp.]|uniref:Sip1-related alpha-galactosidase n=1 Tax=Akkermansia sp. TaxID=1872421 RepID=UPI0025BA6C42|nr:Sip1-related alpha-galactosidase [Akkermansia sp.]MCC8149138.1 hypothetical protein [Akkermansia sp.]
MKTPSLLTLALAFLTVCPVSAQSRTSLLTPVPGKTSQPLTVPPYQSFCWFAADSGRWPGDGNRVLPWFGQTDPGKLLNSKPNPSTAKPGDHAMFALFHLKDGRFMAVLPVASPDSLAWLKLDGDGSILLESGTLGAPSTKPQPVLAVTAVDKNIYRACSGVWGKALSLPFIKGRTFSREKKAYPEPFKYLGWCSWEQYKKNISSKLLEQTAQKLEESSVPVRWMLVDDGFQTQENLQLISFQPRKDQFPQGWAPLMKHKSSKLKWMGLWHCYYGLWKGIHPRHRLDAQTARGLVTTSKGKILPGDGPGGAGAFYTPFLQSVKNAGFDFVKIDVQAEYLKHADGLDNPVRHNTKCSEALEQACRQTGLSMINCMAQGTVNIQNTRYSAATRCSIDYKLGDEAMGKSHILQSYANTLWLGQTAWPDHDMFHSTDPASARLMAVSKAVSGGPVYLSDPADKLNPEHIMPLVWSDGLLLRPLAPAVPLPDSVFLDALNENRLYRVIAPLPNQSAAVVLYNLRHPSPAEPVRGKISLPDYKNAAALLNGRAAEAYASLPAEGIAAYSAEGGRALTPAEPDLDVELAGFKDRLFIMAPIVRGWAVIGRGDKFLSTCALAAAPEYGADSLRFRVKESGPVIVWRGKGVVKAGNTPVKNLGNGFYELQFPVSDRPLDATVTVE